MKRRKKNVLDRLAETIPVDRPAAVHAYEGFFEHVRGVARGAGARKGGRRSPCGTAARALRASVGTAGGRWGRWAGHGTGKDGGI